MNINSFSQPSTLSSEKSSAQGSPLENLMGTMPDGEGENPTFSLDNLLPAFDEPELAANGEEQDIVPDVQIGDTALVQTPADEATQLLNYLLKGESSAATGEVRIGRRGAEEAIQHRGLAATTAMPTAMPTVSQSTLPNASVNSGTQPPRPAQATAMPTANAADMPTLMSAASQVLSVRGELMDGAPASMLRTLLDKSDGSLPSPSSITMPVVGMSTAQESITHGVNSAERPANWSTVKMDPNQQQWSQQLHSVLSDRLQIQTDNRIQHATIRLDPPDMGKIDISLHMDGGKLQVQINASQNDVYKALQHISHELRINLTEQNFSQVSVQVTSNGQQQQQGQNRQMNGQQPDPEVAQHAEQGEFTKNIDDTILTTA